MSEIIRHPAGTLTPGLLDRLVVGLGLGHKLDRASSCPPRWSGGISCMTAVILSTVGGFFERSLTGE